MKVLVIGGRGFIGPFVVTRLIEQGHVVTLFDRGQSNGCLFPEIPHIKGDLEEILSYKEQFQELAPDVVLHMRIMNERVAQKTMEAFEGVAKRIVVPSSMDVYRAYGIIKNKEKDKNIVPTPMSETAPLRSVYFPHGGETEKIFVEKIVLSNSRLPGTILRLPMVYGPGDEYRIFNYLKRMLDNRPYLGISKERARWRGTRGYVENVAEAIVAAINNENAANKIYNVGEDIALSEQEFVEHIADAIGWMGKIISINKIDISQDLIHLLPVHIAGDGNYEQDWVIDTTLIRKELDYKEIVPISEAIKKTVIWNKKNQPLEPHKDFNPSKVDYEHEDKVFI